MDVETLGRNSGVSSRKEGRKMIEEQGVAISLGMKPVDRDKVDFTKEQKAELQAKLDEFEAARSYGLIR